MLWGQFLEDFANGWLAARDVPQLGALKVSLHAGDSKDHDESFGRLKKYLNAGEEKMV